jgi:hypothetical protein
LYHAKKYKNTRGDTNGHRQRAVTGGDTSWHSEISRRDVLRLLLRPQDGARPPLDRSTGWGGAHGGIRLGRRGQQQLRALQGLPLASREREVGVGVGVILL